MTDVFISYSRKDKTFVQTLHEALKAHDRDTWVDWEGIPLTADWWQEIERGIEGANTFVFVISPDSISSKVCREEIDHAVKHNKRLVPIVHREGFELDKTIPAHEALNRHNWLFFRETDDFDAAFQGLITAIDTDLEHVRAHTRLLERAIEWDTKTRNESFALRGDDLTDAERWLAQSTSKEPKPTELQIEYINASRATEAASQILIKAGQQAKQIRRVAFAVAGVTFAIAAIAGVAAQQTIKANIQEANQKVAAANQQATDAKGKQTEAEKKKTEAEQTVEKSKTQLADLDTKRKEAEQKVNTAQEKLTLAEAKSKAADQKAQNSEGKAAKAEDLKQQAEQGVKLAKADLFKTKEASLISTSEFSRGLFANEKKFDALLEGLRAGKQLKILQSATKVGAKTRSKVLTALLQSVYEIKQKNRFKTKAFSSVFSPDGKTIMSMFAQGGDYSFEIRNINGRKVYSSTGFPLGFSSTGSTIVFTSSPTIFFTSSPFFSSPLWEVKLSSIDGKNAQTIGKLLAPSSDSKIIATVNKSNMIQLWDFNSRQLLKTLGEYNFGKIIFSEDDKIIAAINDEKKTIKIWDINGKELQSLEGIDLAISAYNQTIAVALDKKTFQLRDLNGNVLKTLTGSGVKFSPDGKTLAAVVDENTVKLWKSNGDEITTLKGSEFNFNFDGSMLSTISKGISQDISSVSFWDTDQKTLRTFSNASKLLFNPKKKGFAVAYSEEIDVYLENNNDKPAFKLNGISSSFSPNGGKILVLVNKEGSIIQVVDLNQTSETQSIRTVDLFSPENFELGKNTLLNDRSLSYFTDILSGNSNLANTIETWRFQGIKPQTFRKGDDWLRLRTDVSCEISCISPDHTMSASQNDQGKIDVKSLDGKRLMEVEGQSYSLSFSPNNQMIAFLNKSGNLEVWDIKQKRRLFKNDDVLTNRTVFSPDSKIVASVSSRFVLILFDTNGNKILVRDGVSYPYNSFSAAFGFDGEVIAFRSYEGLELLSIDGERLAILKEGRDRTQYISFTQNTKSLTSSDEGGSIFQWDLDLDNLMTQGCNWLHDYLVDSPDASESDRQMCGITSKK